MLRRRLAAFFAVLPLLSMETGCQKDYKSNSQPLAITNRSLRQEPYKLMMIKLKSSALLSDAEQEDGKIILNTKHKEALLKEHADAEAFLKSISKDIKILHRYKMVLNGLYVLVPSQYVARLSEYSGFAYVRPSQTFSRPVIQARQRKVYKVGENTSVKYIGADKVQKELKINGQGVRVGVIDTGIDYTHKMFGGPGTEHAYKLAKESFKAGDFPTQKIVGGIDLVGSDYDDNSSDIMKRIPHPDDNPLDESGHGTHVAGTIAGIGDNENTYTGVAPGASLYAIKVFGKEGSTSDATVIAGLEYAVNPSGNLDPNDHLDVVNLSLGSPFGVSYKLYDEALQNVIKAQIIPIMSAGNSGDIPYITGAPGTNENAFSVASSVDNMDHNWKFRNVRISLTGGDELTKAVEASFAKPIENSGDLSGNFVYIGLANKDLSQEIKDAVKGNVALIDRGGATFPEKIQRAFDAGAIAAVVINNSSDDPFAMGGDATIEIPAIMIPKELGTKIKNELTQGHQVRIAFNTPERIEVPELIDSISSFSSRGPRSIDGGFKPEITAPGSNIISAKVGGGHGGVSMSGTSMAAPHIAGCVALLKQARPQMSLNQIKSLLMSQSKTLSKKTETYPVSRQGAGRVDIYKSLSSLLLTTEPAALSLGVVEVVHKKELSQSLQLSNHSKRVMNVYFKTDLPSNVRLEFPSQIQVAPESSTLVPYTVSIETKKKFEEISGFLYIVSEENEEVQFKIPVLAELTRLSLISTQNLKVHSSHRQDAEDSTAELTLKNDGPNEGQALIFNLLGQNSHKKPVGPSHRLSDICDLESVGYRTIERADNGKLVKVLQIAAKLYSPLTSWQHCELSVQIDADGDGKTDQEMIGAYLHSIDDASNETIFKTILTDADKMREIRRKVDEGAKPIYSDAVIDMQELVTYNHGTLMILNVPLSKIKTIPFGLMRMKIAALASADPMSSPDAYLGMNDKQWWVLDPYEKAAPYYGMPELVDIAAHESIKINLIHGEGLGDMIVYYPYNKTSKTSVKDLQSEIVKEEFLY